MIREDRFTKFSREELWILINLLSSNTHADYICEHDSHPTDLEIETIRKLNTELKNNVARFRSFSSEELKLLERLLDRNINLPSLCPGGIYFTVYERKQLGKLQEEAVVALGMKGDPNNRFSHFSHEEMVVLHKLLYDNCNAKVPNDPPHQFTEEEKQIATNLLDEALRACEKPLPQPPPVEGN